MPNTCQQEGQPDGIQEKNPTRPSFSLSCGCINKSHFYTRSAILTGVQPFSFFILLRRVNGFASFTTRAREEHTHHTPLKPAGFF